MSFQSGSLMRLSALKVSSTQSVDLLELTVKLLGFLHLKSVRGGDVFCVVAVGVRGETLREIAHTQGCCKPPEHSEQINASPSRQERLVTYIYLSAAHRLSLNMLHMCDEGFSKLLSASNFKSLGSSDTPEGEAETSAVRINCFPAFCTVLVTVANVKRLKYLHDSTLVDEDSKRFPSGLSA